MGIRNSTASASAPAQSAVEATVIRCNCGAAPGTHFGAQCPTPLIIPYGTVAYHHRSWWQRLKYRIFRRLSPSGTFWKG